MFPILWIFILLLEYQETFKDKKSDTSEPKNIIVYVGNWHANNYRIFLDNLEFKTVFQSKNSETCIDISTLKQPLFSKN